MKRNPEMYSAQSEGSHISCFSSQVHPSSTTSCSIVQPGSLTTLSFSFFMESIPSHSQLCPICLYSSCACLREWKTTDTQIAQSGETGKSTAEAVGRLFLSIPFSPWNGTGMIYICSGLFLKGLNPLKFLSSQTSFVSSHLFIFCLPSWSKSVGSPWPTLLTCYTERGILRRQSREYNLQQSFVSLGYTTMFILFWNVHIPYNLMSP